MFHREQISLPDIVNKMCHNVALRYQLKDRGFIRQGYFADMVLVDLDKPWTVAPENTYYKCGWSPLMGEQYNAKILQTYVNGTKVYDEGEFIASYRGKLLTFSR